MAYRPQFVYRRWPEPCQEQRCTYGFDSTNTAALAGTLGAGEYLSKIPLLMDTDAPFFFRGLQIAPTSLQIRLEDAADNPLSDQGNTIAVTNFEYPALYGKTDGAGLAALESDDWGVFLPAGGAPLLYVYNPTAAPVVMTELLITLHGVKRYAGGICQ